MQIKAQEISSLLKKQIQGFDAGHDIAEVGTRVLDFLKKQWIQA